MHDPTGFVDLCVKELQLCGVHEGETVAVLSQGDDRLDYADAFLSHIGRGLNENGRWSGLATDTRSLGVEARAFYGNVLFSTGPDQELGGDNDTPCHVDIPMRKCSLSLDDDPILIDADVVVDDMKAPRAVRA